ncbi:MAG: 50S ribosomal protein L24 [Parcubacteria group bacterium]|jgi:large subunit ribosomal protein L24
MRIKKDDKVKIIAGKDAGKKGKVLNIFRSNGKIVVEGINIIKKHVRPKKDGEKGQRVEIAVPIDVSNAMLICPNCSKETRVEYVIGEDGKKSRICKKCKKNI